MAVAPTTTLQSIQTKVRRLTRSPSLAQLTDDDLQNYINTFVVYDFPEHLRMFNLKTTFTFYTNPGQDVYPTDIVSYAGATTNPLYDFQNRYLTVHDPVYIAGYRQMFTQSREQFFNIYPNINTIQQTSNTGDGFTTLFTGVINTQQSSLPAGTTQNIALLQKHVLFNSIDIIGVGLQMVDVPLVDPTTGFNLPYGNLYIPGLAPTTPPTVLNLNNNINYRTGVYTVDFPSAPANGAQINSQVVPVIVAIPQSLLYYDNKFIVRPVPDQSYGVNIEAYIAPTFLMDTSSVPALNEWWQYVSYGAAKKIFEDRMDMESVQNIMPEFKKQEALCLRRTIVQLTNERTATLYTESQVGGGFGGWGNLGGSF